MAKTVREKATTTSEIIILMNFGSFIISNLKPGVLP